jgi:TonB family protein
VTLAEQAADLPQPEPLRPPPVVLRMLSLALPADGNEIAITISQSTAVTIGEANPAEVAKVVHSCRAARLARPRSGVREPDLTLLVRVEQDGRVTDSRVEVGSGDARLDNSALGCLREHGLLTPQQLHGESVASWQRVHWSASGA